VREALDLVGCLVGILGQRRLVLLLELLAHGAHRLGHAAQSLGRAVHLTAKLGLGLLLRAVHDAAHLLLRLVSHLPHALLRLVGDLP
jgi:hypothetical protein